jgi:hypothetical protein
MDGTSIGSLILRADHGPFSVEKPFVTMQDVSAEGGRRRLMFGNLELTGMSFLALHKDTKVLQNR